MIDTALLEELQYALIEPPDLGATWPSGIWTRDEVLDAVSSGVRDLVRSTHLTITRVELPVAALTTTVALPSDWLATGYLVWRTADLRRSALGPVDSFEGDLALPGWETTPGLPIAYADLDLSTLTLRLVPTPAADGTLEILYIQRPPEVTGSGTPLPLAEEFTSAVKYSALSTLLRKVGRLIDPERATYCERRVDLTHIAADIILGGWS
jgi:hypothetical protein